jgi:hypothetical protein
MRRTLTLAFPLWNAQRPSSPHDRVERALAVRQRIAEPRSRLLPGLFNARALRLFLLFEQCQMRFQFLPEVVVKPRSSKDIPEPPEW